MKNEPTYFVYLSVFIHEHEDPKNWYTNRHDKPTWYCKLVQFRKSRHGTRVNVRFKSCIGWLYFFNKQRIDHDLFRQVAVEVADSYCKEEKA